MTSSGLLGYFNYPLVSDCLPIVVCGDILENERSRLNALSYTFYKLSRLLGSISTTGTYTLKRE